MYILIQNHMGMNELYLLPIKLLNFLIDIVIVEDNMFVLRSGILI
jgi:hypothetical protein